jgi:hypothetical protein
MYIHYKVIEIFISSTLKQSQKSSASSITHDYSVKAITQRYILRYRITLYHSIAKLSCLNVNALVTKEPLSRLKVIALAMFEPLSLLKVIALRKWHKR